MKLPLIIDNHFDGIGDAVVQCWVVRSARAAGLDVRLNIRSYPEILGCFGMEDALTVEPGPRWFIDKGQGYHNWQYEKQGGLSRVRGWMKAYGLPDGLPLTRPAYTEHPEVGKWASCLWDDRDSATGSTKRVLIFPECAWPNRQWPLPYWLDLAHELARPPHRLNVLVCTPTEAGAQGFPSFVYGLSIPHWLGLIARADLVIGNDSGPAHAAGTIGTPTLAVMGPTRPAVVFDHLPDVRTIAVTREELHCVSCHFMGEHGFRAACAKGCRALYTLLPHRVRDAAVEILHQRAARKAAG